jgi:hypothetical protein
MSESDDARWLTYAEVGGLLGCTANAARMHAKRRGWLHRAPNMIGGRATVLVPDELAVQPVRLHSAASFDEHVEEGAHNGAASVQALSLAISALTEQLGIANRRLDEERARADQAEAAERIACDELEARKHWGLWRRLRGR